MISRVPAARTPSYSMDDTPARLTAALADRYVIERELGAGGMATVYLAEDLKQKRSAICDLRRAISGPDAICIL